MGRIDVRIVEARNLPNTELVGKPDPYVKVELDNTQHKTSVASSTVNPKWDEVFKFVIADPDSAQLELKLWNKNLVSDAFMGQYRMSLAGLTKGVVKDVWILLQQCKTNAEIHIRLLAHDFGIEPTAAQLAANGVPAPVAIQQPPVVIQQPPVVMQQPIIQQQQPVYQQQPPMYQQQQQPPMMQQQPMYQQQQPPMMQQHQPPMMLGNTGGYPGQYPPAQNQYPSANQYSAPNQGYPAPISNGYPPQQYPQQGYPGAGYQQQQHYPGAPGYRY